MTHCIKHGIESCKICVASRMMNERALEVERRLQVKAMKRNRSRNPYARFGTGEVEIKT